MSARAVQFLKISLLLTPLALLPIASCNGGGGGGGGTNALANALIACNLLTVGHFGNFDQADDAFGNCYGQCLAGGTCAELEDLVCDFGPDGEALLDRCVAQCIEAHGHSCDNTLYPPDWVCDGVEDCNDGSDELGCPPDFMCGDGTELHPSLECNGFPDCEDGTDEVGCVTEMFTCDDGGQIPAYLQCNVDEDCNDGSDEAGCAMISCPDDTSPDPISPTEDTGSPPDPGTDTGLPTDTDSGTGG